MADRVWASVLVEDLHVGDLVADYGTITELWPSLEEEEFSICNDPECCSPSYKTLEYAVLFNDASETLAFWPPAKRVLAFVDPDWTDISGKNARA